MKNTFLCLLLLFSFAAFPALAQDETVKEEPTTIMSKIYELPELSEFTKLLELSGLNETLSEKAKIVSKQKTRNGYTLFAPTNTALAKMKKNDLERLKKPANKTELTAFIQHHLCRGRALPMMHPQNLTMIDGKGIRIVEKDDDFSFGTAKVVSENIETSNGVIYMIDTVQTIEK